MIKALRLIILMIFLSAGFSFAVTRANTLVSNHVTVSGFGVQPGLTASASFTVGAYYGISPMKIVTNAYASYPSYQLLIPFSITNLGNDADSNMTLSVQMISNNTGYTGSNWTVEIQILSSNVGSNYTVPFTLFGEGAILSGNIIVSVPLVCPDASTGDLILTATTASNAGHPVALYTGFNGTLYGGYASASNTFQVTVIKPNQVNSARAYDGFDTITVFDGSKTLRRLKTDVWVTFQSAPLAVNSVYLWYNIDAQPDGSATVVTTDKALNMKRVSALEYQAVIPEDDLTNGSVLHFFCEADSVLLFDPFNYKLASFTKQAGFETILLQNVIRAKGDKAFIAMPEKLIGKNGRVYLYSIAGDLVKVILDGVLTVSMLEWDALDKMAQQVNPGMYFIMIEFEGVKETRRIFVK